MVSAKIIDPAAMTWLKDQEVLKDDLAIEWDLRAHSAQQISNLSIPAACQMSDYVKPVNPFLVKGVEDSAEDTAVSVRFIVVAWGFFVSFGFLI